MDSPPPWSVVQTMLLTVVLPGFGVGAVLLAGVCAATKSAAARRIGAAVALAGGVSAGNLARGLLPWWSLEAGWTSLFPAMVVALGVGEIAARVSIARGERLGLGLRIITLAGCAAWLTPGASTAPFSWLGFYLLLFAAGALHMEAFRRIGQRSACPRAALAFVLPWGVAAATVLIYGALARFCDLAVLFTATLTGVVLVASRSRVELSGLLAGPALFFPALTLGGAANTYSEVPMASFILVALAPCALWSLFLPPMRGWSGRRLAMASLVAVAIPCAIGVILAMRAESLDFGG